MPTPGDENSTTPTPTSTTAPPHAPHQTTSNSAIPDNNAICPPDTDRRSDDDRSHRRDRDANGQRGESPGSSSGAESPSTVTDDSRNQWRSDTTGVQSGAENKEGRSVKAMAIEDDETMAESSPSPDSGSPTVAASPSAASSSSQVSSGLAVTPSYEPSPLNFEYSNVRLLPNYSSSFLRAGSKFEGTQHSDRQVYNVDVEIKHVDIGESFLCGYLRIQGLTEDHPTLTTYFEGEIIGTKHTFQTRHESWGTNEKTDMQHWARFQAWRPLAKQAKRANFTYPNFAQREHLFMRWKEYFLVPDHRVRSIVGASFEGFYYICFNQVEGTVSGIYYHSRSEKYQQLELKHVENRGCTPCVEFR